MIFLSIKFLVIRSSWLSLAMVINILLYTCIAILYHFFAKIVNEIIIIIIMTTIIRRPDIVIHDKSYKSCYIIDGQFHVMQKLRRKKLKRLKSTVI